jgi:hypothetical protein
MKFIFLCLGFFPLWAASLQDYRACTFQWLKACESDTRVQGYVGLCNIKLLQDSVAGNAFAKQGILLNDKALHGVTYFLKFTELRPAEGKCRVAPRKHLAWIADPQFKKAVESSQWLFQDTAMIRLYIPDLLRHTDPALRARWTQDFARKAEQGTGDSAFVAYTLKLTLPASFCTAVLQDPRYANRKAVRLWAGDTALMAAITRQADSARTYRDLTRNLELVAEALGEASLPFLMRYYNDTLVNDGEQQIWFVRYQLLILLKKIFPHNMLLDDLENYSIVSGRETNNLPKLVEHNKKILEWALQESRGKAVPRFPLNPSKPFFVCYPGYAKCRE